MKSKSKWNKKRKNQNQHIHFITFSSIYKTLGYMWLNARLNFRHFNENKDNFYPLHLQWITRWFLIIDRVYKDD